VAATLPEKGKAISAIDPLAMLMTNRVVLVSGVPGSGVTDSLVWILEKQFSADARYLPLYIRLDSRQGKRVVDDDLREAARRVGLSIARDDPLPQAVVAIDDVTLDSDRAFNRLVAHMREHQDNVYVLGCHGEAHRLIEDALSKAGIQPYRMFLGPFGRKEMKQIAAKVAGNGGAKLPDQVLSVLSDKGLPRTPFVMVTLMAVLIQNPDAVVLNATAMVDAYVSLLLGRTELNLTDPMDSRGREHFLEYFAGELTRSGQFWLDRQDLEKLALTYFQSRRLKSSAGRAIEDLIGRKILIDDNGDVGFRHATFQYLFAAKLMAEDDAFAGYVRSKPLEHREIIEHAAGLSRSDRDLLAFVGSVVRPVITEWTQAVANARLDLLSDTDRVDEDIETLEKTMQLTAPPTEETLDTIMDDMWEGRADTPEPRRVINTADPKQVLIAYTALLSDVLVSSELVSDIPLRIGLLKDAIRGWSSIAVALLQQEEEEGSFRKVFEHVILKDEPMDDELEPALDRLIRVIVLFTAAVAAATALGKRQSQGLIREVAADEDFMASAIHALVTTLLAVFLKSPGWPEQLIALKTAHGKHSFVADFVSNLALNRYQLPATTDAEASTLKRFLIDDISQRTGKIPTGVEERQRLRSDIGSRLQKRRTQVKLGGLRVDLLADQDPDVPENGTAQTPITEN
jgi:hypothetical protein